jgi:hypothetical protein
VRDLTLPAEWSDLSNSQDGSDCIAFTNIHVIGSLCCLIVRRVLGVAVEDPRKELVAGQTLAMEKSYVVGGTETST